jgi:hypothetical protein
LLRPVVDRVFSLISVHSWLTAGDGVGCLGVARGSYPIVEGKEVRGGGEVRPFWHSTPVCALILKFRGKTRSKSMGSSLH